MSAGLRDLVDYLPATLAVIISYFSAEVTRGIWKPVPMNGIEWPSPAPVLKQVESEIKAILAASGVDMPSCLPSFSSGTYFHSPNFFALIVHTLYCLYSASFLARPHVSQFHSHRGLDVMQWS